MVASDNKKKSGGGACEAQMHFPGKLHQMMSFVEENGLERILSWELNGMGIRINHPDRLVEILPFFFGQTKYRSFRRQLNMWHFHRIVDGPSKNTFVHPYFQRDDLALCSKMSRHESFKTTLNKSTEARYVALALKKGDKADRGSSGRVSSSSSNSSWSAFAAAKPPLGAIAMGKNWDDYPAPVRSNRADATLIHENCPLPMSSDNMDAPFKSFQDILDEVRTVINEKSAAPPSPSPPTRKIGGGDNDWSSIAPLRSLKRNISAGLRRNISAGLRHGWSSMPKPLKSLTRQISERIEDGDLAFFEGKSFFFLSN